MVSVRQPSKYGNRRTVLDGITFASAAEARYYQHLRLLERAGEITNLELQPVYVMVCECRGRPIKVGRYVADFRYFDVNSQQVIVEDVKGFRTREYLRHRRMMREWFGIAIKEIDAKET